MSMNLTIYHHPRCSKSRKTLEIIRSHGIEPRIVEYLRAPPTAKTIMQLARQLNLPVSALLRSAEPAWRDSGADGSRPEPADGAALAAWLAQHPAGLQRPVVVDEDHGRAVLGRPPENVLELLAGGPG